jgi:hypothetical protein
MVVSVIKELAGRGRDDGGVKTVRWLVAGSGRLASNSQIWFWLAAWGLLGLGRLRLLVGGFGRIGFELANLVLLAALGLAGLGRLPRCWLAGSGGLASNSQIWFWLAAWGWWPWAGCGCWLAGSGGLASNSRIWFLLAALGLVGLERLRFLLAGSG